MNITDIVRSKIDGTLWRITGFYKFARHPYGCRMLAPCHPQDPHCIAVFANGGTHPEHFLPFDLEYVGPVSWSRQRIHDEIQAFRQTIPRHAYGMTVNERQHPDVLRTFTSLTSHQRLQLAGWRKAQDCLNLRADWPLSARRA